MQRTERVSFRTTPKQMNRLFECNRISAYVWNECLTLSKEYALANDGKWIGKTKLQSLTKGKFPIHSQSIQAVVHKYLSARKSANQVCSKGYKAKYPYKRKRHFNTKWAKNGFKIDPNGKIELSIGNWEGKRQEKIVVYVQKLPRGQVKEIELIYDRGLKLCLSYEDGKTEKEVTDGQIASVDQGEIHSITSVTENGESLIVTGRKMRTIKRLRNKKLAELQQKMSKCKKHSRQWRKYNRAKQYVLSKSDAQLTDVLHKTTKQFVDWACQQNAKHVVVGNVEGVQRGRSSRNKKNKKKHLRRRDHNQRMSQWTFGKLYDYLKYKLRAEGITISKINESYTSQTCPVCMKKKKVSSRNYQCGCGTEIHRDVVGAINILSKYLHEGEIRPLEIEIKPTKYLRIS